MYYAVKEMIGVGSFGCDDIVAMCHQYVGNSVRMHFVDGNVMHGVIREVHPDGVMFEPFPDGVKGSAKGKARAAVGQQRKDGQPYVQDVQWRWGPGWFFVPFFTIAALSLLWWW